MKKIKLSLLLILTLATWVYTNDSICHEGNWCKLKHYVADVKVDKDTKKKHSLVKVISSDYQDTDNWKRVFVYFAVENTLNFPITYGWKNKYLKDKNGNMFYPIKGVNSRKLQPQERSEECYTEYSLPKKIDLLLLVSTRIL